MANPFRSEADAYRFLLLTIGYFALIVAGVARASGRGQGRSVFVVLTAAWRSCWFLRVRARGARARRRDVHEPHDERRILVIANETVGGAALREQIERLAAGSDDARVRVVCPALNSPLRHWVSDEDPARADGAAPARREPRAASARPASRSRARSATASRCRRSRTPCARSTRTRS